MCAYTSLPLRPAQTLLALGAESFEVITEVEKRRAAELSELLESDPFHEQADDTIVALASGLHTFRFALAGFHDEVR